MQDAAIVVGATAATSNQTSKNFTMITYTPKVIFFDVQGFRGLENDFIIKELAFVSLDYNTKFHGVYRPPFSKEYTPLASTVEYTNFYIKNNVHNIPWEGGSYNYEDIFLHFEIIKMYNPDLILVKGHEKIKYFLNLYMGNIKIDQKIKNINKYKFVKNIETYFPNIPKLKELKTKYYIEDLECNYHDLHVYNCAKLHAQLMLWYYEDN